VVHLLRNAPHIAECICPWCQLELWFADKLDDLIRRKKVCGVKIYAAIPLPDDDLPDGKALHDVGSILKQPVLHPPFVVIEDRSIEDEWSEVERLACLSPGSSHEPARTRNPRQGDSSDPSPRRR